MANFDNDNRDYFVLYSAKNTVVAYAVAPKTGQGWPFKRLACVAGVIRVSDTFPQGLAPE